MNQKAKKHWMRPVWEVGTEDVDDQLIRNTAMGKGRQTSACRNCWL